MSLMSGGYSSFTLSSMPFFLSSGTSVALISLASGSTLATSAAVLMPLAFIIATISTAILSGMAEVVNQM
ncbi:hypothetical protein D3C83_123340 [compost metagenome]